MNLCLPTPSHVERFARHIRARGHRINIHRTVVPDEWEPHIDTLRALTPQASDEELLQIIAIHRLTRSA